MSTHDREARVATFFLTAIAIGPLTYAGTRVGTLLRWSIPSIVCATVGVLGLIAVILVLGLEE